MDSLETAAGAGEVRVRRATRGFGPGTLPGLRARANEIVTGPEYLLSRQRDEETIWECVFRLIMRVPNRNVQSWAIFAPGNEREDSNPAALAVRVSRWRTDVDLRSETWRTTDQPSVESRLGIFTERLASLFGHLDELDRLLIAGVRLDVRRAGVEWEEQVLERTFAMGALRLTVGRDACNATLESLVDSISKSIELLLAEPEAAHAVDSLDVVYPG